LNPQPTNLATTRCQNTKQLLETSILSIPNSPLLLLKLITFVP
jgi:hypothetical protein